MKTLHSSFEQLWYARPDTVGSWLLLGLLRGLLWPFSFVFQVLAGLRKKILLARQTTLPVPVVVVGNLSVGGTGKTPLLHAIATAFTRRGIRVGIISRGYGGSHTGSPRMVSALDDAACVGDEPLLLAQLTHCPVVIGADRVAAARFLLQQTAVDVILSDDGLQHYALPRQFEIAVLDAARGMGNGFCLPAGPLRESAARLRTVDAVVINGEQTDALLEGSLQQLAITPLVTALQPECWVSVIDGRKQTLDSVPKGEVHALAGIGNPPRFFNTLRQLGYHVVEHPFPDHHIFSANDLQFGDDLPVVMTEKDAVKCTGFAAPHCYALRVSMPVPDVWIDAVLAKIQSA
ncbi:MAG: tetraacyldisaccharide 4'-kinase [Pseudomonadales bacterium]|nr:tetraacyldisaccharide 4'-kinase [Pseudomonadales bacterium]